MHANQDKSSKSKLLLTSISAMKRKAKAKPKALKASKPKEEDWLGDEAEGENQPLALKPHS